MFSCMHAHSYIYLLIYMYIVYLYASFLLDGLFNIHVHLLIYIQQTLVHISCVPYVLLVTYLYVYMYPFFIFCELGAWFWSSRVSICSVGMLEPIGSLSIGGCNSSPGSSIPDHVQYSEIF